jgi:hypothetical protein
MTVAQLIELLKKEQPSRPVAVKVGDVTFAAMAVETRYLGDRQQWVVLTSEM